MKVKFIKQIHSCFACLSSDDVYLEKVIEMLYPPQLNCTYEYEDWSDLAEEIVFDLKTFEVKVYTPEDKELYVIPIPGTIVKLRSVQEIVDEYIKLGWEVRK